MKLTTSILPRLDGTVIVEDGLDRYVFCADESGELVCSVPNVELARRLLLTGNFEPTLEADYTKAEALIASGDAADGETEDDTADDLVDLDAPPVETPAKRKPGKPRKA